MITPPVPNEEWRPIRDTGYEVSSLGRVRHGERIIKGWIETNGYMRVSIHGQHEYVHHLVYDAFTPSSYPPEKKMLIHHRNGNKTDNRLCNL